MRNIDPAGFSLKQVAEKSVLYVMAADAEYGPHLRQRIAPLMTGVGPVEAGVVLGADAGAARCGGKPAVAGRVARLGRQPLA